MTGLEAERSVSGISYSQERRSLVWSGKIRLGNFLFPGEAVTGLEAERSVSEISYPGEAVTGLEVERSVSGISYSQERRSLYDILQIVEYDANAAVLHEVSKRKEVAKLAEKLDVSEAYCQRKIQQVKGPQFPPVRQLTRWVTLNVTPMRIKAKGELRFRVLNFNAFDPSRSIYLDDKICQLVRVDGDIICIGQSGVSCDKVPVCIKQRHEICDERDLHSAFAKYWTQFWNRDDENDPHAWDSWSQRIDAYPMHQLIDSIDMRDIGYWKQTRSDMKTHSSQGVCGWSVPDLKLLSDSIVADLVAILTSFSDG